MGYWWSALSTLPVRSSWSVVFPHSAAASGELILFLSSADPTHYLIDQILRYLLTLLCSTFPLAANDERDTNQRQNVGEVGGKLSSTLRYYHRHLPSTNGAAGRWEFERGILIVLHFRVYHLPAHLSASFPSSRQSRWIFTSSSSPIQPIIVMQ